MDNCHSYVDVSRMVNIVGLYTHMPVWLAIDEIEL